VEEQELKLLNLAKLVTNVPEVRTVEADVFIE